MQFEIYRDADKRWRWRLRQANSLVIAESAKTYAKRSQVLNAIRGIMVHAADAKVSEPVNV